MLLDPIAIATAIIGFAIGGIVKGATGAGTPIVAVPMLALAFDVPTAVTVFAIPNLFANLWQAWRFWSHSLPMSFILPFVAACLCGAAIGTLMLVSLSPRLLMIGTACVSFAFIGFRLARPEWTLPMDIARRISMPIGVGAGVLQGAIGVSAPISITFLSSMGLDRRVFIATISTIFVGMSAVQIPMMVGYGLMTPSRIAMGFGALGLILLTMPLGAALAKRWSPVVFNNVILVLLAVIGVRLLFEAF